MTMSMSMALGKQEHLLSPQATVRAVPEQPPPPPPLDDGYVRSAPLAVRALQLLSVVVPRKTRMRVCARPRPRPSAWWDLKLPVLPPSIKNKNPTGEVRKLSHRQRHQAPPPPGPHTTVTVPAAMETAPAKRCVECGAAEAPKWGSGPIGVAALCNACGIRATESLREPEHAAAPQATAATTVVVTEQPPPQESLPVPDPESPPDSPIWEPAMDFDVYLVKRKPRKRGEPAPPATSGSAPAAKCCLHCGSWSTPQWRSGPLGRSTLCNACGVRYRQGRLLPEYRPVASPTFEPSEHSSSHRQVLKLHRRRRRKGKSHKQPAPPPEPQQPTDDGLMGEAPAAPPEQQQATADDDLICEPPSSLSLDLQFLLDGPSAPMIIDDDDSLVV